MDTIKKLTTCKIYSYTAVHCNSQDKNQPYDNYTIMLIDDDNFIWSVELKFAEYEVDCFEDILPLYQLLDYMIEKNLFFVSIELESEVSINNSKWYRAIDSNGDVYFLHFSI